MPPKPDQGGSTEAATAAAAPSTDDQKYETQQRMPGTMKLPLPLVRTHLPELVSIEFKQSRVIAVQLVLLPACADDVTADTPATDVIELRQGVTVRKDHSSGTSNDPGAFTLCGTALRQSKPAAEGWFIRGFRVLGPMYVQLLCSPELPPDVAAEKQAELQKRRQAKLHKQEQARKKLAHTMQQQGIDGGSSRDANATAAASVAAADPSIKAGNVSASTEQESRQMDLDENVTLAELQQRLRHQQSGAAAAEAARAANTATIAGGAKARGRGQTSTAASAAGAAGAAAAGNMQQMEAAAMIALTMTGSDAAMCIIGADAPAPLAKQSTESDSDDDVALAERRRRRLSQWPGAVATAIATPALAAIRTTMTTTTADVTARNPAQPFVGAAAVVHAPAAAGAAERVQRTATTLAATPVPAAPATTASVAVVAPKRVLEDMEGSDKNGKRPRLASIMAVRKASVETPATASGRREPESRGRASQRPSEEHHQHGDSLSRLRQKVSDEVEAVDRRWWKQSNDCKRWSGKLGSCKYDASCKYAKSHILGRPTPFYKARAAIYAHHRVPCDNTGCFHISWMGRDAVEQPQRHTEQPHNRSLVNLQGQQHPYSMTQINKPQRNLWRELKDLDRCWKRAPNPGCKYWSGEQGSCRNRDRCLFLSTHVPDKPTKSYLARAEVYTRFGVQCNAVGDYQSTWMGTGVGNRHGSGEHGAACGREVDAHGGGHDVHRQREHQHQQHPHANQQHEHISALEQGNADYMQRKNKAAESPKAATQVEQETPPHQGDVAALSGPAGTSGGGSHSTHPTTSVAAASASAMSVSQLLQELHLEQFAERFESEMVTSVATLAEMERQDYIDIGVPKGAALIIMKRCKQLTA